MRLKQKKQAFGRKNKRYTQWNECKICFDIIWQEERLERNKLLSASRTTKFLLKQKKVQRKLRCKCTIYLLIIYLIRVEWDSDSREKAKLFIVYDFWTIFLLQHSFSSVDAGGASGPLFFHHWDDDADFVDSKKEIECEWMRERETRIVLNGIKRKSYGQNCLLSTDLILMCMYVCSSLMMML